MRGAQSSDTNAEHWRSDEVVNRWVARADEHEQRRGAQWVLMAQLLPFGEDAEFVILDLGAGTGGAARAILDRFESARAILVDFSSQMLEQARRELEPFGERARFANVDLTEERWQSAVPASVDAVITSMSLHHLPERRQHKLFGEIFKLLAPEGWYLNLDRVRTADPLVKAAWRRASERSDPETAHRRADESAESRNQHEHRLHLLTLDEQLAALEKAGFEGVALHWQRLDDVLYGGCRPA
jgi:tRNA (cmo5U34)-methyltransferase